jgi:biotin transport system substrate-specific component
MRYKAVYQFRWVLVVISLFCIYLSNFILLELPFIGICFEKKHSTEDIFDFFISFLPRFTFEFHIYSLQTLVVWFTGIILGYKIGLITVLIYLLIGILGFPVFAGGGGLDYYKELTFGYLISLPLNAFMAGWLYSQGKKILSAFIPMLTTHLFGIIYLLLFMQKWLNITWHLSFSMISYDLIFALILLPVAPFVAFFLDEMVIQEVPVREDYSGENNPGYSKQLRKK